MIIRLAGADFSKNNLGQIQFKRELNDETKALLSNYSKPLTESQQFAVQDFIDGLKNNGIWDYIASLYLPVLAGDLSETIYNVKTGVVDATPSPNYYRLTEKGGVACVAADGTTIPSGDILQVLYNGSQQNAHGLVYHVDTIPETMPYNEIPFMGVSGTLVFQLSLRMDGKTEVKLATSGSTLVAQNTNFKNPSLTGFVSSTSGMKVFTNNEFDNTIQVLSTDETYTNFPVQLFKPSNSVRPSLTSYGLVSFGAALTDEKTIKFSKLADTFMSAMGVITNAV